MENMRQHSRHIFEEVIPVYDAVTREQFGQLANISSHGLMLITRSTIESESLFRVSFTLPGSAEVMKLGIESLWINEALSNNVYWAGFEIIDISDEDRDILERLEKT